MTRLVRVALCCAVLGPLAGCLSFVPSMPVPRDFLLEYPPPVVSGECLPVTLRVAPVRAAAIYDREPIAYSSGPYRIGYYYYHRWVTAPSQMLTDLLARDFMASGLYRAVQVGPSVLAADYQLDVRIDRLEERIQDEQCTAVIVLRATLQNLQGRSAEPVALQRRYEESEPVPCKRPAELPAALSRALQRIATALQLDVYQALQRESRSTVASLSN